MKYYNYFDSISALLERDRTFDKSKSKIEGELQQLQASYRQLLEKYYGSTDFKLDPNSKSFEMDFRNPSTTQEDTWKNPTHNRSCIFQKYCKVYRNIGDSVSTL
jgi:hypothetical protein